MVVAEQVLGNGDCLAGALSQKGQKRYRLAVVASHPIQYQSPLFRRLAASPVIDLKVYFCCDHGVNVSRDAQFGTRFKWDIPLLEGFDYEFLKNWSPRPGPTPLGLFNPGVLSVLAKGRHDAVLVTSWMSLTNWLVFLGKTPVLLLTESPLNQELQKPRWKLAAKKMILKRLFARMAAFLCIGSENRDLYRYHAVSEDRLFFCPYAVDNERFDQSYRAWLGRKEELRGKLGIAPGCVVILFCGKLIDKKRPWDLLQAFERLGPGRAALVFVGDGALRSGMEAHVSDKKIQNVHFSGFKNQTELPQYYSMADVFVLPSTVGETWGLVVNEAMCFGLPVVVSDVPGSGKDLVRHGENGLVYPVGDVRQLTECLRLLVTDESLRRSMGQGSRQIISTWSYDEDVKGICAALAAVLTRRADRRIPDVVRAQE